MHFLLVNNNPAVSRLITLSVEKLGFEIDETGSFEELPLESYDIVFVDSALYDEFIIDEHISSGLSRYFVAILPRGEEKPLNINYVLEKPFLPTDFIDLVSKIDSEISDENQNIEDEDILSSDNTEPSDDVELEKNIDLEDLYDIEVEGLDTLAVEEDNKADISSEKDDLETDDEIEMNLDDVSLDEDVVKENEKENIEEEVSEEELSSVLNSEDIDEVKLLLQDDDSISDELSESDILDGDLNKALTDLDIEDKTEDKEESEDFSLDELEDDSEDLLLEDNKDSDEVDINEPEELENLSNEVVDEDVSDLEEKMESMELEDDLNLDEEENEDKIEIEALEDDLEDTSVDDLETELDTLIKKSDSEDTIASSIEDIKEEDLLKALGNEDLDCEICDEEPHVKEEINIEEEIQEKVSKSVKEALESSSIRDALKGMKVNVSISFEEDK